MFEHFNEKARRAIFFARFEAGNYGSSHIDTAHLLLGIAREDAGLMRQSITERFSMAELRETVEHSIERKPRIPTSVEVPLSDDCDRALEFAAEEADKLGHTEVRTIHLILGLLRVEKSFAAKLLTEKGAKLEIVRSIAANAGAPSVESVATSTGGSALNTLNSFLQGLGTNTVAPASFFAPNGRFIDSEGKCWAGNEIQKAFQEFLAPYAKRKAVPIIEEVRPGSPGTVVATIIWQNAVPGEHSISIVRMGLVLAIENDEWMIVLAQATPIPFR
jgi:hypothetical protein